MTNSSTPWGANLVSNNLVAFVVIKLLCILCTCSCSSPVVQCYSASAPVHEVTKSNQRRRNAITAISYQPPGRLHMLMPLQPVTLTSMTSLSTEPDIMLACHRHDLWPLRLSALMKLCNAALNCESRDEGRHGRHGGLMWVRINHLASGINQSQTSLTAGKPPNPPLRPPYTHTETHWLWLWSQLSSWPRATTSPVTDMLIRSTGSQ